MCKKSDETSRGISLYNALPLFFRQNSHIISGPAISPPRVLVSFDYKFRNEISYSLCARSFHPPFKRRIFTVARRPRVETCKYLRRSSRVAHRPFRLTMCTSRSSSLRLTFSRCRKNGGLPLRLLAGFTSESEDTRFYDVQLYERLSEIFHPSHEARRFRFLSFPDVASSK